MGRHVHWKHSQGQDRKGFLAEIHKTREFFILYGTNLLTKPNTIRIVLNFPVCEQPTPSETAQEETGILIVLRNPADTTQECFGDVNPIAFVNLGKSV